MASRRRLLTQDRRVAAALSAAVTAGVLGLLCTLGWLLLLAAVVDRVFIGGSNLTAMSSLLVAMVAALVLRGVCIWVAEELAEHASGLVRARVRTEVVGHLFAVGPAGLAGERVGEVAVTVSEGVESLHGYVTRYLPAAALGAIGPVIVFTAIAILDPWTTLILLFAGPMLVLLLAVIGGRTRELSRRRFDELGWLSAFYLDMIRGLGTLKAFRRSEQGADTIEQVSSRYGATTMQVLRTAFQTSLVMEWASTAATALVAVEVSFRLIGGQLPFGTALAVLVLTPEFFVPFRRVALEYHAGQAGNAALGRIDELLALPTTMSGTTAERAPVTTSTAPSDTSPANADRAASRRAPTIEFADVSYSYPGADAQALSRLRLRIEAAQTVALVGPSGSGKTTVTRLLLRFIEATEGQILVDGQPLDRSDASSWRQRVSWVPQNPTIFAGTVADNIRLGDPSASLTRLRDAADIAHATSFIEDLPRGFDTMLGEQGLRLSGGQRQRLAIARAALREASVVVLDEYTAHLDEQVEAEILTAIGTLLRGRTALVVAHRARTAAAADRVVTLVDGCVAVEEGLAPVSQRST